MSTTRPPSQHPDHDHPGAFRSFRRARLALWSMLAALAPLGAYFHDLTHTSTLARLIWTAIVVVLLGYPLLFLFEFRCPRCGGVYLSTGKLRDFLGLGRILWATRCGICSLRAHG
jgi:hypothetical protein